MLSNNLLSSEIGVALNEMYPMRRELVPCFIGAPGIGKTQAVQRFAREKGAKMVTFILSCALPSEVSGIRMPDNDTKMLEVFDDSRMASLEDGDVLFFDEVLGAPPALWEACLTLIQDRTMASGRKLPDVFIVAASNPLPNPGIVPVSMRDRFQFFELDWDKDAWVAHMKGRLGIIGNPSHWSVLTASIKRGLQEPQRYGYNVLTPRRVSKLMEWLALADDKKMVERLIEYMFGDNVAEEIWAVAGEKDITQLAKACYELQDKLKLWDDKFSDFTAFNMTPRSLFKMIEELDEETRNAAMELLKDIEVEEVDDVQA